MEEPGLPSSAEIGFHGPPIYFLLQVVLAFQSDFSHLHTESVFITLQSLYLFPLINVDIFYIFCG